MFKCIMIILPILTIGFNNNLLVTKSKLNTLKLYVSKTMDDNSAINLEKTLLKLQRTNLNTLKLDQHESAKSILSQKNIFAILSCINKLNYPDIYYTPLIINKIGIPIITIPNNCVLNERLKINKNVSLNVKEVTLFESYVDKQVLLKGCLEQVKNTTILNKYYQLFDSQHNNLFYGKEFSNNNFYILKKIHEISYIDGMNYNKKRFQIDHYYNSKVDPIYQISNQIFYEILYKYEFIMNTFKIYLEKKIDLIQYRDYNQLHFKSIDGYGINLQISVNNMFLYVKLPFRKKINSINLLIDEIKYLFFIYK